MEIFSPKLRKYHYKNRNITIRISKYEYQELVIASEKLNKNISDLIRMGFLGRSK
jgi:hypothetical protein